MAGQILQDHSWFRINDEEAVISPSLLLYPERIEHNIIKMIGIAGSGSRLRPHVKTHKTPEIVKLQMKYGIDKFKCATIAEAEMVASCGAKEVLLAVQPVGPNIGRFIRLIKEYNKTRFSCITDCIDIVKLLSEAAIRNNITVYVWLDINNGMDRTGIKPDREAGSLYSFIINSAGLEAEGLHVYDGHIHEHDYRIREVMCNDAFATVEPLINEITVLTGFRPKIVAGGTPTFPVHSKRDGVETSPGTTLLWDYNYSQSFTDLEFINAAVLFTRVISKPGDELICIDLGHKAVGSEMPQPRAWFPDLADFKVISHNEEHMVLKTRSAPDLNPGDAVYAIPFHICPTVDRYDIVYTIKDGIISGQWDVTARRRKITI
jgi:D-serine deaminase-like pyridoxal phosphate-dependent protein